MPKQKAPVATELTPNEKIVQILLDRLNAHESVLPLFDARADIIFPEATMTIEEYVEEEKSIEKSFPDFRLEITTKVKEQEDGSVVVGAYGHGKHTGEPYGFGPYPAIDAKNVYVRNDPEWVRV